MIPKKVVKDVDERIRPQTEVLVKQLQIMSKKLKSEATKMPDQNLIVEYDNGGGQIGTKENPEWTAYEKLLKSYHATLRAIAAQQGGKAKEKTTGIGSPLTNYRNKYGSLKVVKDA